MHVDIGTEAHASASQSIAAQQALFDDCCAEFSHVRPHEAASIATPAEMFRPRTRVELDNNEPGELIRSSI